MSLYGKESYSQSKCIFLAGPIEWWWQEDRFDTLEARMYRHWRRELSRAIAAHGFLVFRPHESFKGSWNEKMQGVNDCALELSDIVVSMKPDHVEALGTDHEIRLAESLGKPIVLAPPPGMTDWTPHLERVVVQLHAAI